MKRLSTVIMSLAALFCVSAHTEPSDTVLHVTSPGTVVITESPDGITVTAGDNPDNISTYNRCYPSDATVRTSQHYNYNSISMARTRHASFNMVMGGLGFGFVKAINAPEALQLETGKSFELSWLYVLGFNVRFRPHNHSITLGLGLDWRNYRTTTGPMFSLTPEGDITSGLCPDDCQPRASRLKVFSLQLPLVYTQPLPVRYPWGGRMELSIGAIACFNTHASIRSSWTDAEGHDVKESTSSIPHRRFTVDALAMLKISSWLSIYARYSPMDVIESGRGPSFRPLSTGFSMFF